MKNKVDFTKIIDRIPTGYLRHISVYPGWDKLVANLDHLLSYISPDYIVYQVKTKYAGLRYYAEYVPKHDEQDPKIMKQVFDSTIRYHEYLSTSMCETCSAYGTHRSTSYGWHYIACSKHADHLPNHSLYDSENNSND